MDQPVLLEHVAQAAHDLAADLQQAQRETADWSRSEPAWLLVSAAMDRCLARLSQTGCWGEANRVPSSRLWSIAGHWLQVGWLQLHARTKPRGYAGDFEMLEKICSHWLCEHPLGRVFDRYFQSQQAPQAVRNRTALIARELADYVRRRAPQPTTVLSFGSGPAIDVRQAVRQLEPAERAGLRVILMDLDPVALEHARAGLAGWLPDEAVSCQRENLFRAARLSRAGQWLSQIDVLICSGLFDYLDDADATAMLARFWHALTPGGRMLVFHFGPGNTTRAYMEWIGNWYLNYRDRAALRELATAAGIPAEQTAILAESTGANLYWDVWRTARH